MCWWYILILTWSHYETTLIPKLQKCRAIAAWEWIIKSSHISLGMRFLIHAEFKLNHVSKRDPNNSAAERSGDYSSSANTQEKI